MSRCTDCSRYYMNTCPNVVSATVTNVTTPELTTLFSNCEYVESSCSLFSRYQRNITSAETFENVTPAGGDIHSVTREVVDAAISNLADSGNRKEFSTGAKRDIQEGKGRCDLLPLDIIIDYIDYQGVDIDRGSELSSILSAIQKFESQLDVNYLYQAVDEFIAANFGDIETALLELAIHFENGAKKYGEHNWEKGIPVHSYIDSGIRHLLKFYRGDTDERHDRAFIWNMICGAWTAEHKPEMVDLKIQ